VGGVGTISLVVIAIGFFLRRRRRRALAPAALPVVGASQLPMDEIQHPLTMNDGSSSSIPGTIASSSMHGTPTALMGNVRVSCPISHRASMCAHRMRFLARSYFFFFFFDTQDSNYLSTFPAYQGVPQTPTTPQGPVPPPNGTGNSLATMQTSRQQGYHGFPTV
jgi:hypothetical protein